MYSSKRSRLGRQLAMFCLAGLLIAMASCQQVVPTQPSATSAATTSAGTTATTPPATPPANIFSVYARAWAEADYETLYALLSAEAKARIEQSTFVKRYQNIFGGIEARELEARLHTNESGPSVVLVDEKTAILAFAVTMQTLAGPVALDSYQMRMVLEPGTTQPAWKVDWDESLIFPNMDEKDKVQARILHPKRGEIRDRNQLGLAVNGDLIVIGIAPGRFAAGKDEAIPKMAELLGISEERIWKVFDNAKNPDWFYPVVTLPADAGDLSAQLTAIDGVLYQKAQGRVYPAGAAAGLVIGYIGPITAEELDRHPGEGYTAQDKIGKMGLEQVYEARLRGSKGGEITLVDGDSGQLKDVIARIEPVDGESVTLALDVTCQIGIYDTMKEEAGAAAAIDPATGEILALVSTPSFDPNLLQTYVPDAVQADWNTAVKNPFANRFKVGYAPGSVFKLVTAAIGLKQGTLEPDEMLPISGKQWQPDASWGDYMVTRVKDPGWPVTLSDAFLFSDNIYFAQQALRIGADGFVQGAALFGIGEPLPIDYPFQVSQLANQGLNREVLLADTGYGQGEILVSPLHVALFYSTLATGGDLMAPILELDGRTPSVWKEQAVAERDVPLLTEILLEVVEDKRGSGYTNEPAQTRMLGKTGTAELKKSLDDEAEENGWFVAMNTEQPRLTIAMIVEDVKERGGSHYVVPLVKHAMDALLADEIAP